MPANFLSNQAALSPLWFLTWLSHVRVSHTGTRNVLRMEIRHALSESVLSVDESDDMLPALSCIYSISDYYFTCILIGGKHGTAMGPLASWIIRQVQARMEVLFVLSTWFLRERERACTPKPFVSAFLSFPLSLLSPASLAFSNYSSNSSVVSIRAASNPLLVFRPLSPVFALLHGEQEHRKWDRWRSERPVRGRLAREEGKSLSSCCYHVEVW